MKADCGISTLPNWRALFLLFEEFPLAGHVAAIAFGEHVLARFGTMPCGGSGIANFPLPAGKSGREITGKFS
jgi:hypothetical protein